MMSNRMRGAINRIMGVVILLGIIGLVVARIYLPAEEFEQLFLGATVVSVAALAFAIAIYEMILKPMQMMSKGKGHVGE